MLAHPVTFAFVIMIGQGEPTESFPCGQPECARHVEEEAYILNTRAHRSRRRDSPQNLESLSESGESQIGLFPQLLQRPGV